MSGLVCYVFITFDFSLKLWQRWLIGRFTDYHNIRLIRESLSHFVDYFWTWNYFTCL